MADMTLEEALAAATVDEELVTPVNEVLMINPETRTIHVPDSEKLFGVRQDMSVERKYFKCPRIVGDNIDLFEHYVFVNYIPSDQNGKYESEKDVQGYWCKDLAVEGDFITFSWELTENVLRKAGYIAFAVYAKVSDENGNLKNKWHTTIAIGNVLDTLPDGEEWITVYPDIVMQLLERMDEVEKIATEEAMQGYVDDYFNRNPMMIDRELKDATKAAPADIVGKLSEDIADLKGNGSGLTDETKTVLLNCFKNVAWTVSNGQDYYNALENALNASGSGGEVEPDEPIEPGNPEVTLTSISATYTGGEVTVGTSVNDLTGITLTATYSDGSTTNVTDYTLSGTIGMGNNIITVSYSDKTTTFTVTGVAESTSGYSIIYSLTNVTSSNIATSWSADNGIYETTLTPDDGYTLISTKASVVVTRGGVDITSNVYDINTGKITIQKVIDDIVISATATETTSSEAWDLEWDYTNGLPDNNGFTVAVSGTNDGTITDDGFEVSAENGGYRLYKVSDNPTVVSSGLVEAIVNFSAFSPNSTALGFRLLLSDGTNGCQIYVNNNGALLYNEGTTQKQLTTVETGKDYTIKIEYNKISGNKVYLDDALLLSTTTMSASSCTMNRFGQQHQGTTVVKSLKWKFD